MKNESVKALLVEDSPGDAEQIKKVLGEADSSYLETFDVTLVKSLGEARKKLKETAFEVVLLDLGLPDTRGFGGVECIARENPALPIVVLTRQPEETILALEALKKGAQDFFYKGHLEHADALARAVLYSIERKRIEKELIAAKEEALKASRAKSDFLSNMSHDIRTPLNCIIGMADLLANSKLSEEDANYVQMINRASDHLLGLINNILDLSKIESGLFKVSELDFDLMEVVSSVIDVISPRAHAKRLEVLFRVGPEVPRHLVGDAERIKQILTNLMGNAVKFTAQGEVTLAIDLTSRAPDRFGIQFTVSDTGTGIAADKIPVIFEHFTQLTDGHSPKIEGSGLGLSICKGLVDLMKGDIKVESEPGRGSRFTVELPIRAPNVENSSRLLPAVDLRGKRVVVVDDNQAHIANLVQLLSRWGAKVQSSLNSESAVQLRDESAKRGQRIDLWLIDLRMPGVATGGIELSRRLMARGTPSQDIVILLPAIHRHGDLETLKTLGLTRTLLKPVRPDDLKGLFERSSADFKTVKPREELFEDSSIAKRIRVLVADDSEENLEVIRAYLKNPLIDLHMAANGATAVEKFKSGAFDLVLLDIQMPIMNGYETLAEIRKWEDQSKRKKTPVLALTAFALNEESDRCLAAGFDSHVTKPIRRNHLLALVAKFVA